MSNFRRRLMSLRRTEPSGGYLFKGASHYNLGNDLPLQYEYFLTFKNGSDGKFYLLNSDSGFSTNSSTLYYIYVGKNSSDTSAHSDIYTLNEITNRWEFKESVVGFNRIMTNSTYGNNNTSVREYRYYCNTDLLNNSSGTVAKQPNTSYDDRLVYEIPLKEYTSGNLTKNVYTTILTTAIVGVDKYIGMNYRIEYDVECECVEVSESTTPKANIYQNTYNDNSATLYLMSGASVGDIVSLGYVYYVVNQTVIKNINYLRTMDGYSRNHWKFTNVKMYLY